MSDRPGPPPDHGCWIDGADRLLALIHVRAEALAGSMNRQSLYQACCETIPAGWSWEVLTFDGPTGSQSHVVILPAPQEKTR